MPVFIRSFLRENIAQGHLITILQPLKGSYKEGGDSFFTRSDVEKTRGNRYKLHQERLHLVRRKTFFIVRTVNH